MNDFWLLDYIYKNQPRNSVLTDFSPD